MISFKRPCLVACILISVISIGCNVPPAQTPQTLTFMDSLVVANDAIVENYLGRQQTDSGSHWLGGIPDQYGIYNTGSAASIMQRLAVSFVQDVSIFHHSDTLLHRMMLVADFMLKYQHEDGTIDLLSTNFHSPPDLAFAVERIALSYRLLAAHGTPDVVPLTEKMKDFLLKGGEALVVGGIHTPNHRWVVSMALSWLYELFGDERYVTRIEEWLQEKIDIDEDGQFTERSSSVYSPLTDRCLLTIARLLDRPALYDPVRQNLQMTAYYLHPNGEVVTEASRRQDQYQAKFPTAYYFPYRYMARLDQDGRFGAMVNLLERQLNKTQLSASLIYLLTDPNATDSYPIGELPVDYAKHFPESALVRVRKGHEDATILSKNPAFFTMHNGSAVLQAVRLASAFFGKGQFKADTLIVESDKWILKQSLEGPYYQPYPVDLLPEDGNWEKMPKSNRPQSEVQFLEAVVEVERTEDGFRLGFDISGTDHVPVALELAFRKGGVLDGVVAAPVGGSSFLLEDSHGTFEEDGSKIIFGPRLQEHKWTQLRGADPKIDASSVYITGFTPFEYQLTLTCK